METMFNSGQDCTDQESDTLSRCICQSGYYLENGVCTLLEDCNMTPGTWRNWFDWGPCVGDCDTGKRARVRMCDGICDGSFTDVEECILPDLPLGITCNYAYTINQLYPFFVVCILSTLFVCFL